MKAYRLWKDGRRVEVPFEGAQRIHYMHHGPDGTTLETIFEADEDIVDDCVVYRETTTTDRTEAMRQAEERVRENTSRQIGVRLPSNRSWHRGRA